MHGDHRFRLSSRTGLGPGLPDVVRRARIELDERAALCLLSLVLFYHRRYDGILMVPALFAVLEGPRFRRIDAFDLALGVSALTGLALMDNHNSVAWLLRRPSQEQAGWVRPTLVLGTYLALAGGEAWRRHVARPDSAVAHHSAAA